MSETDIVAEGGNNEPALLGANDPLCPACLKARSLHLQICPSGLHTIVIDQPTASPSPYPTTVTSSVGWVNPGNHTLLGE